MSLASTGNVMRPPTYERRRTRCHVASRCELHELRMCGPARRVEAVPVRTSAVARWECTRHVRRSPRCSCAPFDIGRRRCGGHMRLPSAASLGARGQRYAQSRSSQPNHMPRPEVRPPRALSVTAQRQPCRTPGNTAGARLLRQAKRPGQPQGNRAFSRFFAGGSMRAAG